MIFLLCTHSFVPPLFFQTNPPPPNLQGERKRKKVARSTRKALRLLWFSYNDTHMFGVWRPSLGFRPQGPVFPLATVPEERYSMEQEPSAC